MNSTAFVSLEDIADALPPYTETVLEVHANCTLRDRPHHYDALIEGPGGGWIQEFVGGQPLQFLYLMASGS